MFERKTESLDLNPYQGDAAPALISARVAELSRDGWRLVATVPNGSLLLLFMERWRDDRDGVQLGGDTSGGRWLA